jgi:AraC-like DNA-binding protein
MKPELRQATPTPDYSFTVRKDEGIEMLNNWHYHPEVELIHLQAAGNLLVGEYVGYYQFGEVLLLGSNVPHCFKLEQPYLEKDTKGTSICVKFLENVMGNSLMSMPEAKEVKHLLETARHGLRLSSKIRQEVADILAQMQKAEPLQRVIYLLQALQMMAATKEYQILSPSISLASADLSGQGKIKMVFEYVLSHYNEPITLENMASVANMSRESFCRYFKAKTKKTFVSFLMEVRISNACRLLAEQDKNVSEISYLCGYNHVSHFNNQFKSITGKTPLEYKKEYRGVAEVKVI